MFWSIRLSPHAATPARARFGGRLATGGGHQMLGVALALDLNLGRGALDFGEVLRCQLDFRRAEVFLQPMQLGGAGDRHDPGLLGEQPSERDLLKRNCMATGKDL
jgi:hypothetical protein